MGHLMFVILQMRLLRIQFVFSVLLLLVLVARGIYYRRQGRNPYIYGFLWMLPLVGLFAGKWRVFEGGLFRGWETLFWTVFDEIPVFGVIYWVIAALFCAGCAVGKWRLLWRVRHYPVLTFVEVGRRRCEVRVSGLLHSPYVVGTLRPCIVLPVDYESRYSEEELEMVLLHESTHIRCCHNLFFGAASVLKCMFWLNPLVQYGARVFQTDMEIFCDGRVAEKRDFSEYGKLILKSAIWAEPSENVLQRVNLIFSKSQCRSRIEFLAARRNMSGQCRGKWFRRIGICALLTVLALIAGSRLRVSGGTGIEAIFVMEDMETGRIAELALSEEERSAILIEEDADAIVIDTMALRNKLKRQGYSVGVASVWFDTYSFGPEPFGVCREEAICNLYDSSERFLKYDKKITGWKRLLRFL